MSDELTCTLGYHSQTQWLVEPQIVLLYDKIEMNRPVYEMVVSRGNDKTSSLDILLSELLRVYEQAGIIRVVDYSPQIGSPDREFIEELLIYFEREIPTEYRALAIELLKARQERVKRKMSFLEVTEPMYKEMSRDISHRNERVKQLRSGQFPLYAREEVRHCLEHVLFTDRLGDVGRKPIFEWAGFAIIRQWLFSIPSFPSLITLDAGIGSGFKQTTEATILNAFVDIFVGAQEVTDGRQLEHILQQRNQLKEARNEIRRIQEDVWQFLYI